MHTVIKKQEMQLNYQKEQYDKLESSFRETRRIIHEIKHRDGYLLSCLENEEYAKVTKELNDGMDTAYNHFINSVSNNPVIDTFVTNYEIKANEKGIEYETIINTSDKAIPLNDYDLCIIIGNLMDNSFNAAEKWFNHHNTYKGFTIKCLVETKEKYFVIYISNSFDSYMVSEKNNDNDHGYGIVNIQKIVNENRGFYHQDSENNIYETTISIPYARS
jgi:sensor histidine kinase regulating citrate/malate metabolism